MITLNNTSDCQRYRLCSLIKFAAVVCIILSAPNIFSQTVDTLWVERWEGNWQANWHTEPGVWDVGKPSIGPKAPFSGQKCATTGLVANYPEPVDAWMVRHSTFRVPPASENPRLRFWHWFDFSAYDYGEVQIRVGNKTTTKWNTIGGPYYNWGSGVYTYTSIDLSSYADSTVQIAFYIHTQTCCGFGPNTSSG